MIEDNELRDFFAAFAMSRMVRQDNEYEEVAEWSYQMADAMLEARKQKEPEAGLAAVKTRRKKDA